MAYLLHHRLLRGLHVQNVLLDRVLPNQLKHIQMRMGKPNPVQPVDRLVLHGQVPPWVDEDDGFPPRQRDADARRFQRTEKNRHLSALEGVHDLESFLWSNFAAEHLDLRFAQDVFGQQEGADFFQQRDEGAEDHHGLGCDLVRMPLVHDLVYLQKLAGRLVRVVHSSPRGLGGRCGVCLLLLLILFDEIGRPHMQLQLPGPVVHLLAPTHRANARLVVQTRLQTAAVKQMAAARQHRRLRFVSRGTGGSCTSCSILVLEILHTNRAFFILLFIKDLQNGFHHVFPIRSEHGAVDRSAAPVVDKRLAEIPGRQFVVPELLQQVRRKHARRLGQLSQLEDDLQRILDVGEFLDLGVILIDGGGRRSRGRFFFLLFRSRRGDDVLNRGEEAVVELTMLLFQRDLDQLHALRGEFDKILRLIGLGYVGFVALRGRRRGRHTNPGRASRTKYADKAVANRRSFADRPRTEILLPDHVLLP